MDFEETLETHDNPYDAKPELRAVLQSISVDGLNRAVVMLLEEGLEFEQALEYIACYYSAEYFITNYVFIYDSVAIDWIPFNLWDAQKRILKKFVYDKMIAILKTRQVGISWLALGYALWKMLFRFPASILILSKREDEAIALLDQTRLRGMYKRLPDWMKSNAILIDDKKQFAITRGDAISTIRAMSTSSGDSYTATLAIIDEADLVPDLEKTMLSLEPTINAGGQLILISKSNKRNPLSLFKKIYKAGKKGLNGYVTDFVAWFEHPNRDRAWYEEQKQNALSTEGHLDNLYESYPATDNEALAPSSADRRFAQSFLDRNYHETQGTALPKPPLIPLEHMTYYEPPAFNLGYSIGVDCAAGLPTSDYSTAIVVEKYSGRVVAQMRGKIEPALHAIYVHELSKFYNNAVVLPERNNHGTGFLVRARDIGMWCVVDPKDGRDGWNTANLQRKIYLLDYTATQISNNNVVIRGEDLYSELSLIDAQTLKAPEGADFYDDLAIAFCLATFARQYASVPDYDNQVGLDFRGWEDTF